VAGEGWSGEVMEGFLARICKSVKSDDLLHFVRMEQLGSHWPDFHEI
jgi:hypothetical protein